jgi:hypothetical protein
LRAEAVLKDQVVLIVLIVLIALNVQIAQNVPQGAQVREQAPETEHAAPSNVAGRVVNRVEVLMRDSTKDRVKNAVQLLDRGNVNRQAVPRIEANIATQDRRIHVARRVNLLLGARLQRT